MIDVVIGVVAGVISGLIVYSLTERRARKIRAYYYLNDYLCNQMQHLEINMPSEILRNVSIVGKHGTNFYQLMNDIIDYNNPFSLDEKEYYGEDERLAKNIVEALNELGKWAKNNHIFR